MNYKLSIQYDGTKYNGWQKQKNTNLTIQGKLEDIIYKMTGSYVEVHGSGRTDAGVHALNQTANVHIKGNLTPEEILIYINKYLPVDINVFNVEIVPDRFHARLNAIRKTYRYRIGIGPVRNVFERNYIYHINEIPDIEKMKIASSFLIGEHDFASFCTRKTKKSTVRIIEDISIKKTSSEITIDFTGNGFLYNMVRILTGTILEAGLGKLEPDIIPDIIKAKKRQAAGITMPPCGLSLVEVFYP